MNMKTLLTKSNLILIGILLIIGLLRLFPHPPNLTPVIALSVLAAAWFPKGKTQYLVPLTIMLLTDAVIGFHSLMPVVYGSLLVAGTCGRLLRHQTDTTQSLLAGASSSIVFFILSNFGVWAMSPLYPKTVAGLVSCFTMAIPFFHNTVLATTTVVVGASLVVKVLGVLPSQETAISQDI